MAYTPPKAIATKTLLRSAYQSPKPGYTVVLTKNNQAIVWANGADTSQFGQLSVRNQFVGITVKHQRDYQTTQLPSRYHPPQTPYNATLSKNTGDYSAFGRHSLANANFKLQLQTEGFESVRIGLPDLVSKSQQVKTAGLTPLVFGATTIKNARHFIVPDGLEAQKFSEKTWLSHFLRHITTQGDDNLVMSKVRISHHTQFIRPPSIEKSEQDLASNHLVSPTQKIFAEGFEATQWLTRIIPENQTIGITKGIDGEFGLANINNHTQYLSPKGFGNNDGSAETVRFGKLQLFNSTQYISQYFIADSGLTPQVKDPNDDNGQSDFGKWTAINNRNKTIATFGVDGSRFGYQQIDNKAVPVLPKPIEGEAGVPMIAYRVRKLPIDGIEAPHFSYWHIIRNTARVLKPQGFDNQDFDKPSIESNLQTIKQIFPFENTDIGTPMIADRVRFVSVEWRHSINPPTIPLPTIDNHTRYISPKGFDGTDGFKKKFGRAELNERFNIIKAHGREHSSFGQEAVIKNLTPEIKVFGHNSAEVDTPAIRNEWEKVLPFGNQMSAVGTPIIKDRKQKIEVGGLNGNDFGWHFVKKGIAPPYSTQYIELRGFDKQGKEKDGFGIEIVHNQVPSPVARTNVLAPTGIQGQQFGKTILSANSIHIDSGIFELSVGKPKVWVRRQYISPVGMDYHIDQWKMGKPQLSPHTIYAPSGENATSQAVRNHGGYHSNQKPIDGLVFGQAVISNQNRTIFQTNYYHSNDGEMSEFGWASIGNKNQVIKTRGFRGGYFGWHMIPFVPQTIEQFIQKEHKTAFGEHQIGFPYKQNNRIGATGFNGAVFGETDVSHFHRAIYPAPFIATQIGQSKSGDTPFMWQGLRIGERVLGNYGGFDGNVFGQAWISNKIREVNAEGFDGFISEADIKSFKGRLTVKRAIDGLPNKPIHTKKPHTIGAVGIAPNTVVPVPNIKNKVHYIRPDGNSEQFRKGAW